MMTNLLRTAAAALICTFIAALPARSQQDLSTVVLVATPALVDPEYRQTVLLATATENGGHVGIILNRPTQRSLASLFPDHGPSKAVVEPVFFGGPFGITALTAAVHSNESPGPGSIVLMPGVFLAVGVQTIDKIIEERPNEARYYIGHVGWRPGELRAEVERGLWYVMKPGRRDRLQQEHREAVGRAGAPGAPGQRRARFRGPELTGGFH